jgi:hypothetical protein
VCLVAYPAALPVARVGLGRGVPPQFVSFQPSARNYLVIVVVLFLFPPPFFVLSFSHTHSVACTGLNTSFLSSAYSFSCPLPSAFANYVCAVTHSLYTVFPSLSVRSVSSDCVVDLEFIAPFFVSCFV